MNEWISVNDSLPEFDTSVLCCQRSGEITQVFLHSVYNTSWITGDGHIVNVFNNDPITHWMSLPDPPKKRGGIRDSTRYEK